MVQPQKADTGQELCPIELVSQQVKDLWYGFPVFAHSLDALVVRGLTVGGLDLRHVSGKERFLKQDW